MRPNARVIAVLTAALLAWAVALPVAAQDERPQRTPAPRTFPNASILTLVDEMDDPVVNSAIVDAVNRAASEIRAKDLPRVETLDETGILDAAIAAGEDEDETSDLVFLSGVPQADTIDIAREFPDTVYIGVGQGFPCVTEEGFPDPDRLSFVTGYLSE